MRVSPRVTSVVAAVVLVVSIGIARPLHMWAQQNLNASPVLVATQYAMTTISSTGAVNAQVTLTIPAPPPGSYNYVCSLHFNASHDGTGTTVTSNGVTTSTNFNSWALKFSLASAANNQYDWYEGGWGVANVGCAKSIAPGTATTFVSPSATATTAFTWTASYYQAP